MRPPRFWDNPPDRPGLVSTLLLPLSWAFARATARRVSRAPRYHPGAHVICVGNLNAGGTGKTPAVIAIAQLCGELGLKAAAISRGYGGSVAEATMVDPARHRAEDVGDEPLLLAAFLPVFVCPDRAEAARLAEKQQDWDILIMDDGFQNPDIRKDTSIVVVDAAAGFGNGRVIPSGPLREPPESGLRRADAILLIGDPDSRRAFTQKWTPSAFAPVIGAELKILQMGIDWDGLKVLAFAGIGRPEKFFRSLALAGADIVRSVALDDHQPLTDGLLSRISSDARNAGAQLVTTEKDAVRLPESYRPNVLTLPVRLEFDTPEALRALVARAGG